MLWKTRYYSNEKVLKRKSSMKKKQIGGIFENKDIINSKTKPKIIKSSLIPPVLNPNRNMYSSPSLETNITTYNVVTPGVGTGDVIMATHNPSLLAISKRAKSTNRPKAKPSLNFPPVTQGVTSLLSKKPLSDLPDPTKEYFEKNQQKAEMEKKSLSFKEDPIAYFSKRKDGRGHLFIYMVYKKSRRDPEFSPYELVKVPFSEVENDYFTMSASGVTHIDEFGNTENITLDRWAKEESAYLSIKKLKMFRLYFYWKPLRVWRNFVKQMHFQEKVTVLIKRAFFYHEPISKASLQISCLISSSDSIITKYLFPFEQSKKFTVFDFNQSSEWNFEELQKEYKKLIDKTTEILNNLYLSIDNPSILHVDDSEFKEIKRKNPNITNLKILEQKKENERISRSQKMESEINSLSGLLRMLDYLLLESLRRSCYESFKNADSIISSDLSAIFTIEVTFSDEGDITFSPNKDEMLEIVNKMLRKALMKLDSLQRIIQVPELRDLLKRGVINISELYKDGPNLLDILDTASDIKESTNHINEVISDAYDESYKYLQPLVYFYPLYKLGKTWDVRNYLIKRNGSKFTDEAHFSDDAASDQIFDFLENSEEQPVIDFEVTEKVIDLLRSEAQKVDEIRLGTVKGPLYVDSKKLKAELIPIPSRSLKSLESTFSELISTRITLLNSVFQSFIWKMNQDPNSLDLYVDFSHIVQKATELFDKINDEIQFIDKSVSFFEKVKFSLIKNPLHPIFERFKADHKKALQLCEKLNDKFTYVLSELIKKKEVQINQFKTTSQEIPISIKDIDLENFFKQTLKLKSKCEQLEEPIEKMLYQQKVLNMNIGDFKEFAELKENIAFSEKIYQVVKNWQNLNNQITSIPFAHISMNELTDSVNGIQSILDQLKEMKNDQSTPILDELNESFSKVSPFVDQLTQLDNARMHTRHWENLFDLCGHKGEYSISITIQTMIDQGILSNKDIINEITNTSIGESQLDIEFQAILAHWADVTVPFVDQHQNDDDQLLLGDLSSLLNEIKETSVKLNKMLSNRFVKGIKNQVEKLSKKMPLYMNILDQWQFFQGNWTIISTLFKQSIVRDQLPHQTTRFEIIRKKWQNIVQHSKSDTKIFNVCSYQNMLEDFIENNKSLQIILESISPYLESKRKLIPRLYFLSNLEVLTLLSTKDFSVFTKQITKVMMNIQRIDCHLSDENETPMTDSARESCNFIGLKIFGIVGDDGDSLPFVNAIQCPGSIDQWLPQLFEMMETSTKDALSLSLSRFASSSLTDWAMSVSSSIAMLTLQISYTRDVEDCFNNLEANPRSFAHFEQKLKTQIHDLINLMSTSLSSLELYKISYFLGIILNHYESSRSFQEKIQSFSHIEAWHDMIKFKYDTSKAEINIVIGDKSWLRGHEHWGGVPRLIFTQSVSNALSNILISKENNQIPLIFGSSMSGKSSLLELYSFIMGRFCYTASSFPNLQSFFIKQILIGATLTGCSLIFKNIDQFSLNNQAKIFDYLREITDDIQSGNSKFKVFNDDDTDINPDVSFMFTATDKYSTEMSPQLRDFIRPISLSITDIRKLAESCLISSGFKTAKVLSSKLDDLTKAAFSLFDLNHNRFRHIIAIVIEGHNILLQMMHKIKIDGYDYSKEPKKAEKYAISRAAFNHFKILIDPEKQDLLLILLHSTFHLSEDIELFSDLMMTPYNFYIDKASDILRENVKKAINELNYEVPSDYLLMQAQSLMEMMFSYPCIIINGPPNSGKTLLVNLLSNAFAAMLNDSDLIDQYRGLMPFKIESIYHQSDSYENIFGSVFHDNLNDHKWMNGIFQSTIAHLEKYSKTNHRILRFDGVLTPELEKFLCQFVSIRKKFRLNNLGSFANDRCFHCIIETNDISNISPQLLNLSAVLTMNSVQYSRNQLSHEIDLLNPSIPFSFVRKEFDKQISEDELSIIYQIFSKVAPIFVLQFKIDFSTACIRYCLNYLLDNKINCMNEELVLLVMCISFYTCYCSHSHESHTTFSDWVVGQFSLNIPSNWEEFIDDEINGQSSIDLAVIPEQESIESNDHDKKISKVRSFLSRSNHSISTSMSNLSGMTSMSSTNDDKLPPVFVDFFVKPTLENIKVENDKIIPIETSFINERIIVEGCQFADDIIVPNVQHLSAYSTFKISMKPHSHIFLNGPANSGKFALLKTVFSKNESICPVFFNVSSSKGCTIKMIVNKIKAETNMMQKTVSHIISPKLFALVFNDLSPENINVTEFIRKLINENKIILTSKVDPNYYNEINIDPDSFFIVVRSESNKFDARFLKHFLIVHINEYTHDTKMYIANKAMGALGISIEMIQLLVFIFEKMDYSLSEMITSFITFANINVNSVDTIRVLMSSIYFNRYNIQNEEKFDSLLDEIANESIKFPSFQESIVQFKKEKIFARAIQNVTSEVLTIDRTKIKEFMSNELNSTIYDESVYNFIQIDHSIGTTGHNCVIYSSTSSSQMTLLTLVCKFQKSILFEVFDIQSIKEFISKLIDDDGIHVHVLVIRKISYSFINSILKIFKMFIFYSIYSEDEIVEMTTKVFSTDEKEKSENNFVVDQSLKQKLFDKLKKLIRYNCRIAILPSNQNDIDNDINDLLVDFDYITLIEPSKHSICVDMIKQDAKQLEIVLIEISEAIEPYLPYSNITQFYDFVSSFVQYMTGDMKNAKSRNEEMKNALDFLEKLSLENSVFTEKLNQIQPKLETLQKDAESSQSSYQSKNDVISMRKLKLNQEKIHLQDALNSKIEEMKQAQSDMDQLAPNVEIALQRVKELKQTDIDPIRITESDPCESLKLMLEAIAVLIGVPNTSYETFGHSLLMDERFVSKIVDNLNYQLITSTTYEALISYLNNEKLSKKELESVAPVLVILRNLLESVCAYTARNNIYRDKKIQVEMTKQTLTDFNIDMDRELASIHEIELQLDQEHKKLMQIQVQNNEIEKQYDEIEKQKKRIDSILQDSFKLKEFWSVEVDQVPGNGDTMVGDSILMAVYITYAGMLEIDQRMKLLEIAQSKLIESSLMTSFSSPVSARSANNNSKIIYENEETNTYNSDLWLAVTSRIIAKGNLIQKSTFLPRSALVDIKHMEIVQRIPLVVDPDQVFIELFQNEKMLIISLLSSSFSNAVSDALQKGKLLIITDVNEFDQKITDLISYIRKEEGSQITIGQKTVKKHSNFRVILISSLSDVDQIPAELQIKVSAINVGSSSIEIIHTEIVNLFVDYFEPKLMPKIVDLQKSELAHQVQIKQYEMETLKCFTQISNKIRNNGIEYNYLDDDEMIDELLKNKNLFFQATGMDESAIDIKKELQTVIRPFKQLINIVETFWICTSRYLPKIKSYYHFSFTEMISVVKEVFVDSKLNEEKEIDEEKIEKLKQKLISKILNWLYPMISFNDSIFFLFLIIFTLNDGDWDDLSSIIQNLASKINSKLTNQGQFESLEFDDFIEKLKNCEICDFFALTKGLISSFFGDKFENEFPFFQIEKCVPPSYQSPSLIISDPNSKDNGPLMEILKYVKLNGKLEGFECLSLFDDDINLDEIKKKIQLSLNRGNWILLNYSNPSKKAASVINDILYITINNPINTEFKLFVNCYTTDFISTRLLSKSKIITMNDFPSIRKNMVQIYHNCSSLINGSSSKTAKRLFYIGSLIYSILKSRTFLQPFGFNEFYGLDESSFNFFIKYSIKFIERYDSSSSISQSQSTSALTITSSRISDPKKLSARSKFILEAQKDPMFEIPIRNLREFVQNICFGPRIVEKQDRRRLRAITTHFFLPELFGDSLNYIDQRLPNAPLFTIPADGCIGFFIQQIEASIPAFGIAEAIMAHLEAAKSLVNWNLSKWAAIPFLSILNKPLKIDDTELNIDIDKKYPIDEINEIEEKPLSPLLQFWLNEITAFNYDAKKGITNLIRESKWRKIFNDTEYDTDSFNQFHLFMKERRDFLINAYSEVTIEEVNLKYLNDIRGFFDAYKLYYCLFNDVSSDTISINFHFTNTNSFFVKIVGLSLFNATIKNSILFPIEKEQDEMKIFTQIPPIFMSFGEKLNKSKIFLCPLFRSVFYQKQFLDEEETDNFIIDVELNASKGDKFWLLNSTSLYVFVPAQMFL